MRALVAACFASACASPPQPSRVDAGAPGDAAPDAGCATPCASGCCLASESCLAGRCAPNACATADDCTNDTCCAAGACEDWSGAACGDFDASCGLAPPSALAVQCTFPLEEGALAGSVVADLDLDGVSEIVFADADGAGSPGGLFGTLRAIRGDDCTPAFEVPEGGHYLSFPAVGNLDDDPELEIVTIADADNPFYINFRVRVYNHDGSVLAQDEAELTVEADLVLRPVLAQLDGAGFPEILVGMRVLRYDGDATLEAVWDRRREDGPTVFDLVPVVGDVDLDGTAEVVAIDAVYDGPTGEVEQVLDEIGPDEGGFVDLADFDASFSGPELVRVLAVDGPEGGETLVIQTLAGTVLFGPVAVGGERPTIADFDGDGAPELAVVAPCDAGSTCEFRLELLDLECAAEPAPPGCAGPGVRWTRSDSWLREATDPVAFDFDGDGASEIVQNDICFLRILDGRTGATLAVTSHSAWGCPLLGAVADVDADAVPEIAALSREQGYGAPTCPAEDPETGTPFTGYTSGLTVFTDPGGAWRPARSIWNQAGYHITNVLDDGTIPLAEEPVWEGPNSAREQLGLPFGPPPDLTASPADAVDATSGCPDSLTLAVTVSNRGAGPAPAGIDVTFFEGEPGAGGEVLCSARTVAPLAPGEGETVSCDWADPPATAPAIHAVADRDRSGLGHVAECHEGNNVAVLRGVGCGVPR